MSEPRIARSLAVVVSLAVILSIVTGPVKAHDTDIPLGFETIDTYVQSQIDDSRIPGAAIAIVQGGEIAYSNGFGTDDGAAIGPHSAFPIGSLTKSFTALAIMQLAEAGTIDLDAPLQRYIPWFGVADTGASASITVRMLLNQTSGFSRATGNTPLQEEWAGSPEDYVRALSTVELNRTPGQTYEYSNTNYVILGLLIEIVSGQEYGDYVQQHIFDPLGMTNSYTSHEAGRLAGMVDLHRYWFGVPLETTTPHLPGQISAGFLVSTADDMARYLTMYLNDGTYEGHQILSPDGIAQMLQPATNEFSRALLGTTFDARYGMGWFAGPFGAQPDTRWHMGELPMFNVWMVLIPETNQAVVVLFNANSSLPLPGAANVFSRIPTGVASMLAGEDAPGGMSLSRFYLIFNLAVIVIISVQVAALARLALRPRPALTGFARRAWYTSPLIWELGLSLLLLLGLPALIGVGWRASFAAMPDLTLVVATVIALWFATGLLRIGKVVVPTGRRSYATRTSRHAEIGAPAG
jgi:CubicO group peptidase (beta-lactamase class C family)